jgi:hypothetical protein
MNEFREFIKYGNGDLVLRELLSLRSALSLTKNLPATSLPAKLKYINNGKAAEILESQGYKLMQWDISSAGRILFSRKDDVTLFDFSLTHDCLEKWNAYRNGDIFQILQKIENAPKIFTTIPSLPMGNSLLENRSGPHRDKHEEERWDQWTTFLDKPQQKIANELFSALMKNQGSAEVFLLLGAAGTGKTLILRNLATRLYEATEKAPDFLLPSGVKQYFLESGGAIPGISYKTSIQSAVLVDDPLVFEDFETHIKTAESKKLPVVIAIDPIQWVEKSTLGKFAKFISTNKPKIYELKHVYRQGENVGRPALEVIKNLLEKSTRYVDPIREIQSRQQSAPFQSISTDDVTYSEQAGTYKFIPYDENFYWNILLELEECAQYQTIRKWPKLLVGTGEKGKVPVGFPSIVKAFSDMHLRKYELDFTYHARSFSQVDSVRGTEYESVFIFMDSELWHQITNGVPAPKDQEWEWLNTPLTFMTRAENRCTIFEIPTDTPDSFWVGRNEFSMDEKTREKVIDVLDNGAY